MTFIRLVSIVLLSIALFACKEETTDTPFVIEGITSDTYPKVDGSTSTEPLQTIIACKLLGGSYYWRQLLSSDDTWAIQPNYEDIPFSFFTERIKTSQTHNSIINLIDKNADFILSARKMSDNEKAYAANAGVTLIETPIALDAFIFIANPGNQVKSLTTKQVQDIYMGNVANWKEVGGSDAKIKPHAEMPSGVKNLSVFRETAGTGVPKLVKELMEKYLA